MIGIRGMSLLRILDGWRCFLGENIGLMEVMGWRMYVARAEWTFVGGIGWGMSLSRVSDQVMKSLIG
jgi:hypothetical protein